MRHSLIYVPIVLLASSLVAGEASSQHPPGSRPVKASQALEIAGQPVVRVQNGLWRVQSDSGVLLEIATLPAEASNLVSDSVEAWAVEKGWQRPSSLRAWRCVHDGLQWYVHETSLHADPSLHARRIVGATAIDDRSVFVSPGLLIDRATGRVQEGHLPPLPGFDVAKAAHAGGCWAYLAQPVSSRHSRARTDWMLAIRRDGADDRDAWAVVPLDGLGQGAQLTAMGDRFVLGDATGIHWVVDGTTHVASAFPSVTLPPGRLEWLASDGEELVAAMRDTRQQLRIVRIEPGAPSATTLDVVDADHDLGAFAVIDGRAWLAALHGTEHSSLVAMSLDDGSVERHWVSDDRGSAAADSCEQVGNFFLGILMLLWWPFLPEC